MFTTCCCANDSSPTVCIGVGQDKVVSDIGKDAMREDISDVGLAETMQSSSNARFPGMQFRRGPGGSFSTADRKVSPGRPSPSMSSFTPLQEEKDQEKARLQSLVSDFKRDALEGIVVDTIDPESLQVSQKVFSVDRLLDRLQLREVLQNNSDLSGAASSSRDAPAGEEAESDFEMKDFCHIYKDARTIGDRAPKLSDTSRCVGIAVDGRPHIFFYFETEEARDRFYTCLKILHMSANILRSQAVAKTPSPSDDVEASLDA